tara:strand:+ start:209 stop:1561 length:1353 start_codon:yes stop_codon:yes gene_type:complete
MATLKTASASTFSKYIVPVTELITRSMEHNTKVKVASKEFTIVNNNANKESLKSFAELASSSSSLADALELQLETVERRASPLVFRQLNKPTLDGGHWTKGDVAEGVVAAAIAARFIHKNTDITFNKVFGVLNKLIDKGTTRRNKGLIVEENFDSPNQNPDILDNVKVFIGLAEGNMNVLLDKTRQTTLLKPYAEAASKYANSYHVSRWSKLFYENNRIDRIEVTSDGVSDQSGTKVDLRVSATNDENELIPININLSIKADDVKQFGQVSGIDFSVQENLWESLFGYGKFVKGFESEYNRLYQEEHNVNDAVNKIYREVNTKINEELTGANSDATIRRLAQGINHFATLNEENVTMLDVGGGKAKVYRFDEIYSRIKEHNYKSILLTSKTERLHTIQIVKDTSGSTSIKSYDKLIQFRIRKEVKSDGSPYIRNLIEKNHLMGKLLGENF